MKKNEFKNSNEFDAIFKQLINLKKPSMVMIQRKWKLSFKKAKVLYEEVSNYHNEVFIHSVIYELSFWEEHSTTKAPVGLFFLQVELNFMQKQKSFLLRSLATALHKTQEDKTEALT